MLENVRRKHLLSAASWEYLARVLRGRSGDRHALPLSKLPVPLPPQSAASPRSLDSWENEGGNLAE